MERFFVTIKASPPSAAIKLLQYNPETNVSVMADYLRVRAENKTYSLLCTEIGEPGEMMYTRSHPISSETFITVTREISTLGLDPATRLPWKQEEKPAATASPVTPESARALHRKHCPEPGF